MSAETVVRRWTMASWLVADAASRLDAATDALRQLDVDAIALQSIRRADAEQVAHDLDVHVEWELSYHPVSRLLPGSGVGLAVLSRHDLHDSVSFVTNNHPSIWSSRRRIAQFAVVRRADHSAYTVGHAADAPDPQARGVPPAPLVWFRPPQVGLDVERAVELPADASILCHDVRQPIEDAADLLSVTFEMPWVEGGFADR